VEANECVFGHRNTTAVVASNVERTKCGRVIFSASGEENVYSIYRGRERGGEGERDMEREREREKAITKQCYLN
jgi:hypothetical protein